MDIEWRNLNMRLNNCKAYPYSLIKNSYTLIIYDSRYRYDLMLRCWNHQPEERPNFSEIVEIFGNMLDPSTREVSVFNYLIILQLMNFNLTSFLAVLY